MKFRRIGPSDHQVTLGDALGRLVAPPTAGAFEPARLALVDQLLTAKPTGAVTHASWLQAFELGAHGVADLVAKTAQSSVRAAAERSRMPPRMLATILPDASYRDLLYHRLLSAGIPLEKLEAGDGDPAVQRQRGVALESAWDEVTAMAAEELTKWRGKARGVQEWRRPTRSLWLGSGILLLVVLMLAAWLGGIFRAPSWFEPIGMAFWSLF